MPAVNSSESPGRNGNSRPDSTKTTTATPTSAHPCQSLSSVAGSNHPMNSGQNAGRTKMGMGWTVGPSAVRTL